MVSQNNFYAKETIIQMLVGNHFLKNYKLDNFKSNIDLANTVVVLPEILFVENIEGVAQNTFRNSFSETISKKIYPTVGMENLQIVFIANQKTVAYRKLQKELFLVKKIYRKEYKIATEDAEKKYLDLINPILEKYILDSEIAKKTWCAIRDPKIIYDPKDPCNYPPKIVEPKFLKFDFVFRHELEITFVKSILTTESFETLLLLLNLTLKDNDGRLIDENLDDVIGEFENIDELNQIINQEITTNEQIIIENTVFPDTNTSLIVGGVLIPVSAVSTITPFSFTICPTDKYGNGLINFILSIQISDSSWIVNTNSSYQTIHKNSGTATNGFNLLSVVGNTINLKGGAPISTLEIPNVSGFEATISFTNGQSLVIPLINFNFRTCVNGEISIPISNDNPSTIVLNDTPFIPLGFGLKQIGIADYKKVEQSVQCYVEGEVANIENIMARERREKTTRKLTRNENTQSNSSNTEKEQITDTIATNRFEMHTEVANIIQENQDMATTANLDTNYFDLSASFATHTSNEESIQTAITQSKEITEKATDRISTKVNQERIVKIIEEFEEHNLHEFDNRKGDKHVVGVYRWVDKVYKNQLYNYGKRLMFEFMIPEPSRLHLLGMKENITLGTTIVKPIDPRLFVDPQGSLLQLNLKDYKLVNDFSAKYWAGIYNVEITNNLDLQINISHSFSDKGLGIDYEGVGRLSGVYNNNDLKIPENYQAVYVKGNINVGAGVYYGGPVYTSSKIYICGQLVSGTVNLPLENIRKNIAISGVFWDARGVSGSLEVTCERTPEAKQQWQIDTFKAIITAYEEHLKKYETRLEIENAKAKLIKETNSGFYRQIENVVLRKNCISYIIDQTTTAKNTYGKSMTSGSNFGNYEVTVNKNLDDYAALVKFIEQSFEWDIMSYNFYPFYWGNRQNWSQLYQNDNNDALFRSFLQSGMARVIITVRPGFEEAVRFYMQTGQIWNGGAVPVIEDKLFMSIVDELRKPEGNKEGKAWVSRVPTSLTILQANSIGLEVKKALPCNCEDVNSDNFEDPKQVPCSENFVLNNAQINGDAGTAKIFGKIEGNNGIKAVITLKTLEGLVQEITICDEDGNWEITALPAGKYELLIDSTNKFASGVYLVTNGEKANLIELEKAQTQEFNLTVTYIIK